LRRVLLVFPVALVLLALLAFAFTRGRRSGSLAGVPGYGIDFPAGTTIVVRKVPGLLGATSQEDRIYGTAADRERIAAHFFERLTAAGYRQVTPPEAEGEGDRFLGRYEQGKVSWLVILRPLPQRIDGHTYEIGERGFQRVVVVRIEA